MKREVCWAISIDAGFYSWCDFSAKPYLVVAAGHESHVDGQVCPMACWITREKAEACLAWLGDAGAEVNARVVMVERSWVEVAFGDFKLSTPAFRKAANQSRSRK